MVWRLAKSLGKLRDQINAAYPGRDKSSDGTIGDMGHSSRASDHSPNKAEVVTALDTTHDPKHGLDAGDLAEQLRRSKDPRIKYVISNARIFSSSVSPWRWRFYSGANAHRIHVHISAAGVPKLYDDESPWKIAAAPDQPVMIDIIATEFGGAGDEQEVAYADVKSGWANRPGVALPMRFLGRRPMVQVTHGGKSVDCSIVDVGPWYPSWRGPVDPYWTTGARPRAETDKRTNGAGIDLTPGAAKVVGLKGKGKVTWEFIR